MNPVLQSPDPASVKRLCGRVGVLCGGLSPERDISLQSGEAVHAALAAAGLEAVILDMGTEPLAQLHSAAIQSAFLVLHGPGGEDGSMQALLEALRIPYTGSGVAASALALDKYRSKLLWQGLGLPTAPFELLRAQSDWVAVLQRLGGRVCVKPAREGSSLGMSYADSPAALREATALALEHDRQVIAERWLPGREFSVAVLAGCALPAIELRMPEPFYTYEAKYLSAETEYLCPAPLQDAALVELERISLAAFDSLGCAGWGRVDVRMDESGAFQLLEVNGAPGMTAHSLVPMAAAKAGLDMAGLCLRILQIGSETGGRA